MSCRVRLSGISNVFDDADELADLRDDVRRLLAAALAANDRAIEADLLLADQVLAEAERIEGLHDEQMATLRLALESRDLIGRAKGIIMATTRCTADQAFDLLVRQSQHENRKLTDIAAEIDDRAERRAAP
jgi:hypothetical protein